jgi:transposase
MPHLEVYPMAKRTTSSKNPNVLQPVAAGVYAGLDYHKKFTVITIGDGQGAVLDTQRVTNDKHLMRLFFQQHPGVECAIESCRGYEWLLDYLKEDLKLTVHLVNVHQAKLITQSRCKTDRLDSKAIMELLAKHYLPTCYQPTPDERRLRERLRWRAHLVRYSTRMKVRIHALIDKENANNGNVDIFSAEGRALLKQLKLSPSRRQMVDEHLEILDVFEARVKAEDAWVRKTGNSIEEVLLLQTIPGIGEVTSLLLYCEIGEVSRFRSAAALASYFGLVPGIESSADKLRYRPITKQGSSHVRWMIIQCAWRAIRNSAPLLHHFGSVSRRCGRNSAIVSVARKLLKIAYHVLRDKKPFNAALVGKKEAA